MQSPAPSRPRNQSDPGGRRGTIAFRAKRSCRPAGPHDCSMSNAIPATAASGAEIGRERRSRPHCRSGDFAAATAAGRRVLSTRSLAAEPLARGRMPAWVPRGPRHSTSCPRCSRRTQSRCRSTASALSRYASSSSDGADAPWPLWCLQLRGLSVSARPRDATAWAEGHAFAPARYSRATARRSGSRCDWWRCRSLRAGAPRVGSAGSRSARRDASHP